MDVAAVTSAKIPGLQAILVARGLLDPSPTNPRKRFDEALLQELASSMAPPVGILEPLVVRPKGAAGRYEIIAGERRWRAAKIAGLEEVPVVIRSIADDQVIRLQLIENKNREDIHPLEEAVAMGQLLKLNRAETPRTIAASIGMSERYVQNRLRYLSLVPEVKTAFVDGTITAGHADLLMRLPADDQRRAFKDGCFENVFEFDDETRKQTRTTQLRSVRDLNDWIEGHIRLQVTPKTPEMDFLPEVAEAVAAATIEGAPKLLELIDSHWVDPKVKPAPLTLNAWAAVKKGDKCDHQARGVLVFGRRRGQVLTVCTGVGQCKLHWKHSIRKAEPAATPKGQRRPASEIATEKRQKAEQAKEKLREQARAVAVKAAIAEAKKKAPEKPTPALLKLYGFKSWRAMAADRLDELTPYSNYVGLGTFKDVQADVALFGVKLVEPTIEKPAAKGVTDPNDLKSIKKQIDKRAAKKAPAKRKAGKKR